MELGINHFETARGYGCSEVRRGFDLRHVRVYDRLGLTSTPQWHSPRQQIQYGQALKRHPRGSMIVQTKVRPFADPAEFRATLETSLKNLDVEYIDLFGFHGINKPEHLDWIVREGGCLEVVRRWFGMLEGWMGGGVDGHTQTYEAAPTRTHSLMYTTHFIHKIK